MSCQQNEHDANVISRKWMRCYEGHERLYKRVTDLGQESGLSDWWLYDEAPTITTTDSVGRFAFYFLGGNPDIQEPRNTVYHDLKGTGYWGVKASRNGSFLGAETIRSAPGIHAVAGQAGTYYPWWIAGKIR